MIFSKQIAALQGQLNAANGNVAALTDEKAKLETRVQELEAGQEGMVTKAAHDAAIALKDTEIAGLTTQLTAAKKDVDVKVVEKIAEAGVPAAVRDPKAIDTPVKPNAGTGDSPRKRLASLTKIKVA